MYKIIGADGQEYGPSSAEELRKWVREGRADGRSMVKLEGTADWKPLASFPELAMALPQSPFAGQQPPPAIAPSAPVDPRMLASHALAEGPELRIGECLGRGWNLLMSNFGLLFFAAVSVSLIQVCLARIPVIGVLSLLLMGAFQGGVYLLFIRRMRGQPAGFGTAFAGFGEHFVQLLLVGIVMVVLTFIGLCFCLVPGIYLSVAWALAVPLAVDKDLRFWDALEVSRTVVTKYWFQMFLLIILAFLPAILFSICFKVVTLKFAFSMYHSGQLNPALLSTDPAAYAVQAAHVGQLMNAKYFWWAVTEQVILIVNQPFARAVLVQAYEILLGPRHAPPA